MPTRVGLREVAQRAGVSIATVSNTLNRPERVSDTTRERVLAIMEQMGFVRNELARQLRTGGTMTIGMVVLNIANPFFASLAHAVEDAAEALGCTTVLGSSGQKASWERRYLDLFEEQQSKGVLIAPLGGITARMRELHSRGMPMVVFSSEEQPDFCTVTLDGRELGSLTAGQLTDIRKNVIGLVFQQFHLIPHLTAVENVMVAQYYHSMVDEKEARQMLDSVGLADRAHHLPSQLSGGEQQRVCIARALINRPELVLADEPTGNLDETNEQLVLDIFGRLHAQGTTLIVVTHDAHVASNAQREILLNHGRLVGERTNGTGQAQRERSMLDFSGDVPAERSDATEDGAEDEAPPGQPASSRPADERDQEENQEEHE